MIKIIDEGLAAGSYFHQLQCIYITTFFNLEFWSYLEVVYQTIPQQKIPLKWEWRLSSPLLDWTCKRKSSTLFTVMAGVARGFLLSRFHMYLFLTLTAFVLKGLSTLSVCMRFSLLSIIRQLGRRRSSWIFFSQPMTEGWPQLLEGWRMRVWLTKPLSDLMAWPMLFPMGLWIK